ncbi:MAG: hypothetical protein Q4F27_05080, partial [Desulfovibrionaceae bacterium]|nr:hypothetical protein [Desulfovibrionaceae bacterium]
GLVAWTYWNLGPDLCGLPEPEATERETNLRRQERRAILQRILAVLGHPLGTHTFWPCCLPVAGPDGESRFQPHADAFWSGLAQLGSRGLVVMGSAAVKALELPSTLRPKQQTRHRGHLVWVLPDVEYLLEQNDGSMLPIQPEQPQLDGPMLSFLIRSLGLLVRH